MNDLPSSWDIAPLGDIARVEMGQSPDSRFYNDRREGLPFFQGKAEFGSLYPTVRKWCSDPKKIADRGDILLSVRAPVGPTNVAAEKCCIGRGLAAIRAHDPISQTYLLHLLRNLEPWLSEQGTGTTFAAVSGDFLRDIDIALAPFNEQKRIANKLDALLARVDACRNRLDRIPNLLKRFRQAVVSAAVSARLTEDWRRQKSISAAALQSKMVTLDDLCIAGRVITYGVIKLGDETPDGVPCLRTSNVRWLQIDTEGMKRIAPNLSAEYSRTILQGTEVLVNVRGTLGGVAVASTDMVGWNVSREVAVVPIDSAKADSEFLALWVASDGSQRWLSKVEKGVAYVGINIEDLRTLPVELPSLLEQREIVRRVNSLFAYADRLEARYADARTLVDKLTPATLAKAFRGELVPQDPNDEPASVLLERVRATTKSKVKLIKTPRKAPMTKHSTESVKTIINQMPQDRFSFDELRNRVTADYEVLKDIVFALLSESEPMLRQVFDEKAHVMRLEKV